MPVRENPTAYGTGAHPGPTLYCHIVQTWLPTACPGGSEAVPRKSGREIRLWANHSQSICFRWELYESIETLIKGCFGDINL